MRGHGKMYASFARDRRGAIAIAFAVAVPVLLLIVAGSIDFAQAMQQRSQLQKYIDAATLAAAKELGLSDARRENVQAVVAAIVTNLVAANVGTDKAPTLQTTVNADPLEVRVVARQETMPYFGNAFGLQARELEVVSVARILGRPNICILALDQMASGALSLEKNAKVTGQNCAVFSNSTHANGIKSKNSASLSASTICSAGGRDGGPGNFTPEPYTDCPTFEDPLASRPEPFVESCSGAIGQKIVGVKVLPPGTYCGGLTIGIGADVRLDSEIVVIKDGPLLVEDGARLTGAGVGIHLTGEGAVINFAKGSTIDLAAPTSGAMAGLLMFEARAQPVTNVHQILSDDARNLLGTIYLPRGRLHIDADAPVADKSSYTAIVARMITLYGGPDLVLNTNYSLTDVPVPEGIRGAAQPVSLVQ